MSHRLQVLIPEELDARVTKAAQRNRVSKGAWVRAVIENALETKSLSSVERMSRLNAPTADIEQMLADIEAGRR